MDNPLVCALGIFLQVKATFSLPCMHHVYCNWLVLMIGQFYLFFTYYHTYITSIKNIHKPDCYANSCSHVTHEQWQDQEVCIRDSEYCQIQVPRRNHFLWTFFCDKLYVVHDDFWMCYCCFWCTGKLSCVSLFSSLTYKFSIISSLYHLSFQLGRILHEHIM